MFSKSTFGETIDMAARKALPIKELLSYPPLYWVSTSKPSYSKAFGGVFLAQRPGGVGRLLIQLCAPGGAAATDGL